MRFWNAAVLTVLTGLVLVSPVQAGIVLDWDPAFGWVEEPSCVVCPPPPVVSATNIPAGYELKFVGDITDFGPPLDFLDPSNPGIEYTFYVYGLISQGTVAVGPPATTFYTTDYSGGFIEVYEDNSPDFTYAPFPPNASVPSTFTDGTLILSGNFTRFVTETNNFTQFQIGHAEGDINWTGGTLLGLLTDNVGDGCPGLFTGALTWRPSVLIDGYLFRHDGKIDLNCPQQADIDVHPTSCPNPINTGSQGLTPVALLGSPTFDLSNVEVGTILLEGIEPVKIAIDDVSQPVPNRTDVCDCTTAGPDGFDDLLLKFDTQELISVLGPVQNGDIVVVTLTGNYIINGSQTTFEGQDCIRIISHGGGGSSAPMASLRVVSLGAGGALARIDFTLTERERVNMTVVDVGGRTVARLSNGWRDAGNHSLQWKADGLPSGVYFVRMEGETASLHAKHVLVR